MMAKNAGEIEAERREKKAKLSEALFFCVVTVMFYGGLTLCAYGIEGVAWYSGTALAAVVHGLLLSHREGAW